VVTLGLLGGAVAFFFLQPFNPTVNEDEVSRSPGLYVSVIHGTLLWSSGEEEEVQRVVIGDDLSTGGLYMTERGSIALLRSSARELEISLRENTTISLGGPLDKSFMTIADGEVNFTTRGDAAADLTFDLGGLTAIFQGDAQAEMVRKGDDVRLFIRKGSAVLRLDDEEWELDPGESASISDGEVVTTEGEYIEAPQLISPAGGTMMRKTIDKPLSLDLLWMESDLAQSYRVEVASDRLFQNRFLTRTVEEAKLTIANIPKGIFYWRITPLGLKKVEGEISAPSQFSVQLMVNPEDEIVSAPDLTILGATAQSNIISLTGQTEPGARVVVHLELYTRQISQQREIIVDPTGAFRVQLESAEKGEIRIIVRAFYRPEFLTTRTTSVFVDF
jgi:hypothetical protein